MNEPVLAAARDSGLVKEGAPLLVMVSGGGDSVALLDVAVRLGASVTALHVNYGLREGAGADEELVRELAARMDVPLHVHQVTLPAEGNLQELARGARYSLAEQLAEDDYAAAHTASDQAETVLYRLAVSPGSRALHGMAPRRGRLVRPLLEVTREEVRDHLRARGLEWREDPSNADRRFARARIRHDVLDALRELSPAAERTIAETARQLRDEAEVLDAAVAEALEELGAGPALGTGRALGATPAIPLGATPAIPLDALREHPRALQRLILRALAGRALSRDELTRLLEVGNRGTVTVELGGGLRAIAEYGTLRFSRAADAEPPAPVELAVPGRARFGDWELEARLDGPGDVAVTDLGSVVTVRAWRDGDRMRPAGLGGSKSLQDLFTDRKVPRALRRTLPVVESAGEIVWVAGVAVDERFAAREREEGSVGLTAKANPPKGV
ncbi:MAG TPA: tRNA lysidine(34) synthetase TilS [Thermoleophilaceae bacterium]